MLFAVIQNIPSPYRLHMFNVMRDLLGERGWEFEVNFMSEGHGDRPAAWRNPKIDFPHRYWPDHGRGAHHFNPGMIRYLRSRRPDALLVGSTFDTFTSIAATYLVKAPVRCAWSEGNTKTTGRMHGFKGWLKREIFSHYPFIGVPGSDAAAYVALHQSLTRKKMPECVYLPNIVDESKFRPRCDWPAADVEAMRATLVQSPDTRICLVPARLEPVKGLVPMIGLLEKEWLAGWKIVIMGQGPLEGEIKALARSRGLEEHLTILPYVPYAQMPLMYAAADLMMLPSVYDPNPLSVVEALHSALPVALSDRAGNVEEGVADGKNGWRLDVRNHENFKRQLAEVFAAPAERLREMGGISRRENAQFWNSRATIARFLDRIL